MKTFKIIAFSDVTLWSKLPEGLTNIKKWLSIKSTNSPLSTYSYEEIVDILKPDVTILAGDYDEDFYDRFYVGFYKFLKYAGERSKVLVITGNHEDPKFGGSVILYSAEKVNNIKGCREISGKRIKVNGFSFLGLGYYNTYHKIKPLIEKYSEKVDIIVSHCDLQRLPALSNIKPKLIINGHSRSGKVLVRDVPVILTNRLKFVLIEFKNKRLSNIQEYKYPFIKDGKNWSMIVENSRNPYRYRIIHSDYDPEPNYDWVSKYKWFRTL